MQRRFKHSKCLSSSPANPTSTFPRCALVWGPCGASADAHRALKGLLFCSWACQEGPEQQGHPLLFPGKRDSERRAEAAARSMRLLGVELREGRECRGKTGTQKAGAGLSASVTPPCSTLRGETARLGQPLGASPLGVWTLCDAPFSVDGPRHVILTNKYLKVIRRADFKQ